VREPDPLFADPRLAVLYDVLDDDRSDLELYEAVVREVGASTVVDIGCGTGSLAVRLAAQGRRVVGVDPARASLDVARSKPCGDQVEWLHGDATALDGRPIEADLAVMTGNVAQVFVDDVDWAQTLAAVHGCLRAEGWFVFETRRPEVRDWEHWDIAPRSVELPSGESIVFSLTVTAVEPPLVTFESTTVIAGERVRSTSTLRFRERAEIERDLATAGFRVQDVRDAPDRPGKELVLLARRLELSDSAAPRPVW
jgi:ubiquinone/menaquinone biosynthesis C-methylase UbiE